jgi:hypothetical protein
MTKYKFLAKGAVGPITGFSWPLPPVGAPGAWVEVDGPLVPCARGVHVCRSVDLPHWLHDELWETETDGEQLAALDCLVVRRARLVRRIDAWSRGGAARFADACIEHAIARVGSAPGTTVSGFLADAHEAVAEGYLAIGAFCAALAVARSSPGEEQEAAYRHERVWQAGWITGELLAKA